MLAYPLVEHLVEILEPWDYGDDFSPHYSAKQTATLQNCSDCWLGDVQHQEASQITKYQKDCASEGATAGFLLSFWMSVRRIVM